MLLLFTDGNVSGTVSALNPQLVGQLLIFDCDNVNVPTTTDFIVGEALILRCVASAMTSITDLLTFIWSSNNTVLRRVDQTEEIRDHYVISQLNTSNEGQEYMCEVIINSIIPERVNSTIELTLIGKLFTKFTACKISVGTYVVTYRELVTYHISLFYLCI